MTTRREFLVAGGLALAGHLLPFTGPRTAGRGERGIHEIAMHASPDGSRVWFDPVGLRVEAGATVRWTLRSGVHTTTAYHPENGDLAPRIPDGTRPWDSGYLSEPGASFAVALERVGTYDFFCRPHEAAGMAGRIVVVPSGAASETGSERTPARSVAEPDYGRRGVSSAALRILPPVETVVQRGVVRTGAG